MCLPICLSSSPLSFPPAAPCLLLYASLGVSCRNPSLLLSFYRLSLLLQEVDSEGQTVSSVFNSAKGRVTLTKSSKPHHRRHIVWVWWTIVVLWHYCCHWGGLWIFRGRCLVGLSGNSFHCRIVRPCFS